MTSLFELLIGFLSSFGLNLIPFAGPSNLLIASNFALILGTGDPPTLVALGFLIALAAALAKSIHYLVTFFVGKHLSEKYRHQLDVKATKIRRWAFPLLFVAAVTPIPDEPIVIPLGLMKYSPIKFFIVYFSGKALITIVGVFLGSWTRNMFSGWLTLEAMIALSIMLTIVITIILLKVDVNKYAERFSKKRAA